MDTERRWADLPAMTEARSHFCPCVYAGLIYLPGGRNARTIEVFCPADNAYRETLLVTLSTFGPAVSWVSSSTLSVISKRLVTQVHLQRPECQVSKYAGPEVVAITPPVLSNNFVYITDSRAMYQADCLNPVTLQTAFSRDLRTTGFLFFITQREVHLFDPVAECFSAPLSLPSVVAWDECSRYVMVSSSVAFCCGLSQRYAGTQFSEDQRRGAFLLHFCAETVRVEALPPLLLARECPGLVQFEGALYVFGGDDYAGSSRYPVGCECHEVRNTNAAGSYGLGYREEHFIEGYLKQCESYTQSQWAELPTMTHPRCNFDPCVYLDKVYLPGGLPTSDVEAFSPGNRTFEAGYLRLPEVSATFSRIEDGKLIVLTRHWKVELNLETSEIESREHQEIGLYTFRAPFSIGSKWFLIGRYGTVFRVKFTSEDIKCNWVDTNKT